MINFVSNNIYYNFFTSTGKFQLHQRKTKPQVIRITST